MAVVDSGIDASKTPDFGSRIVASVNLNSDNPSATGDDEGHGTMVAGIAAGSSQLYPGVASGAPIVSVRTADANGASHMSDVIAACDWILQNQSAYDIRVANFSLVSEAQTSFVNDPLDAAVEQLWFHGIVVVAAVGNYGSAGGALVAHAPGNDPFVVTVGALDTNGTAAASDDFAAPWSAYGHTGDGFAKPEISAPGRWIVAPVPAASTLATTAPDRVVAPGYMWMSGTSLAAPVVSGAADLVLGAHPDWTPGQVKSALMVSASALPATADFAGGVGEVDAARALGVTSAPDADTALEPFVASDGSGFDGAAWEQAATDWSATDWSATDWSATDWSATDWSATDWSATDWSATDWSATDWSATDWSATDWSATDWSATDWSAANWLP
jgi:serine protease AprX